MTEVSSLLGWVRAIGIDWGITIKPKPRRVLITGGAGFIGTHLAYRLSLESDIELVLVDNFNRGQRDAELENLLKKPNMRLITADLTDPLVYQNLGRGYSEVYHLAAIIGVRHVLKKPQEVLRVNAVATLLVLDWFCQGGGERFLFTSTSEAYAWTQSFFPVPVPTPENVPLAVTEPGNPRSSYAVSKIFGEVATAQYCGPSRKHFAILRYHNVYGPRMGWDHVIPQLFERARQGQNPLIVYSAQHRRSFCYVDDAIEATILAMRSDAAAGETFNVGNDQEEISMADLAHRILSKTEISATIEACQAGNDPIKRRCPNLEKARRLLGYEPRFSLDQGLDRTLKWYDQTIKTTA